MLPLTVAGPDTREHASFDLRAAVSQLPDDLRRVVALRFYADMDSTEIGAVLETPAGTVRTRLQRALWRPHLALGDDENTQSQVLGEARKKETAHE